MFSYATLQLSQKIWLNKYWNLSLIKKVMILFFFHFCENLSDVTAHKVIAIKLNFSDTIAFHAVLRSYAGTDMDSAVVFETVFLNEGNGYKGFYMFTFIHFPPTYDQQSFASGGVSHIREVHCVTSNILSLKNLLLMWLLVNSLISWFILQSYFSSNIMNF